MFRFKRRVVPPIVTLGPGNYRRLAQSTGMTRQHISRVLRGVCGSSFTSATKIANAANVSLDQLREHISRQIGIRGSR